MVVCCDPLYPQCCDTDTVCVFVNAPPVLTWPTVYPDVCQNGGSITLNPADIFVDVNNTWVMSPFAGGTGVFSGTGVVGNTFTPGAPGLYTICFTYTDSLGCSNTICNTINVIFCCDTTYNISAGNDTTICTGGVAILTVTGCNGPAVWYALTGEGPIPVGQGPILDVLPQQSTCYIVICCNPLYPQCCDTDTVCVFVNAPPVLTWPTVYPDVCQNGGSITLNPADIFVDVNNTWVMSPFAGGTGVFSGTGVLGNTFTPGAPGLYTICFTYTDSLGCSSTICNTINVIFCCDTLSTVSAGNDTTICAGGVAILTATGCAGTPTWHILTGEGPVPVVQGAIFDVFPQTSTCYMVICCDPLYPACCDTDTVCVFVNPLPVLSWPTIYTDICNNGGPITLNPADVFVDINNTWVMSPFAGGTGVFSGPGVFGNTFTPPGIGSYVITFTYTDANGCVATISNSITVIFCCDTLSTVSAGNDTTICAGGVAILTATGCTGNTTWYQMGVEGPFVVGQGPVFDALPQQSTCYMVVCCDPLYPACCDTDTVCVFVNPLPVLSWPTIYTDICNNGGPITLNPADVFVDINNTWVMSPFAGGTGVFSGPGVFGNTFTPPGIGSYVITFTYTDANGCVATISNSITVIFCCDTLSTVSAGNDTTICAGGVAILTATGCTGNITWYQLGVEGPFVVGQGPVFDALPQQSTCYMVVCCDPLYPACCDTDTVCVYVGSQPVLSWPSSYPEICQNGGPITLNPADIFVDINNTWVMSPFAGGTGVFSGTGVVGNTFTPGAPGLYTICFTFTNQAGCSSTICKTISVIYCCDAQINISAGNDTTICSGSTVTIAVTGCSSLASWYWLTAGGPAFVGLGPSIQVGLTGNTIPVTACYMVVCCDPVYPQCCDTDTVCVTILPVVSVGPITGTHLTACLPAIFGGSTYSVPAVSGATYQWTVPAGMSISSGQGTPIITTTWTNLAMNVGISGQLCVYQITPCGVQLICTPIDLNAVAPVTPPSISGPAKVCPGNIVTSYNWTLPAGMTITSGAGTNVITVSVGPGFVGGSIVLTASNACGTSPARTKAVMLNPPLTPGPISGPSTGVCGTNGAVYTIVPVPNAVSYLWTVTNGTIVGANTGTSIVVNWNTSFTSAVVTVRAVNGCGMGAIRTLNVSGAPATPGPITGPVNVCSGATYHYSTATVAGASQYTWVTPGTIVSGQGTKDIDVVFNTVPAANQVVSVRASNPCGNSAIRVLNGITISFCIRMDNSDYDLLSVYPNPAHEQFEINYITMKDSEYRMDMIDAEGRVVWNMKGTGDGELLRKQVDVTGIARGLYLIRLNDEEGVKQLKIIIN
ncbi:MAG: T9SS type A sorting domain-containing protein [Bacteroidetes bacterium]|nr:T9SS type A sorting domain-containing protein [Bacteroidota bacterium]